MSEVLVPLYHFTAALESAVAACAAADTVPLVTKVWVRVTDGVMVTVEATDRYRLATVDVLVDPFEARAFRPDAPQVALHRPAAANLLKVLKGTDGYKSAHKWPAERSQHGVRVRVTDGGLYVELAHGRELATIPDQSEGDIFPAVRNLTAPARGHGAGVILSALGLDRAADGLSRLPETDGTVGRPVICLTLPSDGQTGARVSRADSPDVAASVLLDCQPVDEALAGVQVRFNPTHLREAIKSTGAGGRGAEVTLWLPEPVGGHVRKPVRFSRRGDGLEFSAPGHYLVPMSPPLA